MKTSPLAVLPRLVLMVGLLFGLTSIGHAAGKVAAWGDYSYGQTTMPNGLKNIKAVAAGNYHSLALRVDGTVVGWGQNAYGQATPPSGLSSVVAISAGGAHNLALRANGTVATWGYNNNGQTNVPDGLSNVRAIAAGGAFSLALKTDGTVAAWGYGGYGLTNFPATLSDVLAISANALNALALKADGTVVAWGYPYYGVTNVPAGLSNVVAISAGFYQSLALKADGTVVAWGYGATNLASGLSNLVAIAAGSSLNLALAIDGAVVGWTTGGLWDTNTPPILNATAVAVGVGHGLAIVPDGPPEILIQPADAGVLYQSNIVLSVTANGYDPLGYQWLFNGAPLTNSARVSGVTTTSLNLSDAQFSDIGSYTVIASNAFGSVQSTSATLTVISPPILTQHPAGQTVIAGTNITLLASAIGTPPLGYQWLLDGVPVGGAISNSLTLSNIQSSQGGNYSLMVTNAYGTNESLAALVTVLESPPYILTQPTNITAFLGGFVTFNVNARGSMPLDYQWRFNGAVIPGETNATLTLASLRYDQAGFYTVVVNNAFGALVSAKVELTVQQVAVWGGTPWFGPMNTPPELTNLVSIAASDNYVLGLKSDGTVTVWDGNMYRSSAPTNIPPGLNGVTAIAAGYAHCLVLRSNGTVTAWGGSSPFPPFPPFPSTPSPTNVPTGLSNVIAVAAGDYHGLALYTDGKVVSWGAYRGNFSIGTATNVPAGVSNVISVAAGGSQSLALKSDGRVIAWGYSTNVPATLSNVIAIACTDGLNLALLSNGKVVAWIPTSIIALPPRLPANSVATNVPASLSNVVAIATGGPGAYAMALKSDGTIAVWGYSPPQTPAGLSNAFAISVGGNFLAALVGDGAPRMTIQPATQTVSKGANVQFHARAVGVQPLNYQWQLDGVNLPGTTNADLTLTNAQGMNTGNYRVVVANPVGSITSTVATLTIPFSSNLVAALNATNLVWTTSPTNAPWFAQIRESHDDNDAAQSGHIAHNQQSTLQTTVVGPGTLTFWWKVSSEQGYDRLWFSMDFQNWSAWISGETDWQPFTFHVPAGSHVLNWAYAKDGTVSAGQDAGWLDEVVFTPASPLTLGTPHLLPDGSFTFSSTAGRIWLPENLAFIEIQASTNLRDWITLTGACTLTNGSLQIRDVNCTNYPNRFYRVIEH